MYCNCLISRVLRGIVLVALLIKRRDHEPLKFMGHDLKQFKSMEGFLESGPQFALQTYILLIGQKKDTNIDFNKIDYDDVERLIVLSISILISFISLVKTAYQVNVPDPDPRRRQKQDKKSSKWKFKITNGLFNTFCVLFRILSLSYLFVYLRQYTVIIIAAAFVSNIIVLSCIGASVTIVVILGTISIFVPNGYLLYNFAGTLTVDFTRRGSQIFFLSSSLIVNVIWMLGIGAVLGLAVNSKLPKEQIIGNTDQYKFVIGMTIGLFIAGVISSICALIHWFISIERLFEPPEDDIPYIDEEDEDIDPTLL